MIYSYSSYPIRMTHIFISKKLPEIITFSIDLNDTKLFGCKPTEWNKGNWVGYISLSSFL